MSKRANGKTTTVSLEIWWNPEDRSIHIATKDSATFISTVNDDPTSVRGHPHLFQKLASILRKDGKPAPL